MTVCKLEICCYTAQSAFLAEAAGAHRIELCDNYLEGGTTPSFGTIKSVVEKLQIPVNVIVRPRGGDFLYSKSEFEIIKEDVRQIKELGANGIVIGFLLPNGQIDVKRTAEIIELADNMDVTFHRAFDMVKNPLKSLEQLKKMGIKRVLTSGGQNSAMDGLKQIAELVRNAINDIIIMPGSGVNSQNIQQIQLATGAQEFHSSAKTFVTGGMNFENNRVSMSGKNSPDEYKNITIDSNQVQKMVCALKRIE